MRLPRDGHPCSVAVVSIFAPSRVEGKGRDPRTFLNSQYAKIMPNTAGATISTLPIRSARMSSAISRLERAQRRARADSGRRLGVGDLSAAPAGFPRSVAQNRLWFWLLYETRQKCTRSGLARIPDRTRACRPPWVRSFCPRASSRACESR